MYVNVGHDLIGKLCFHFCFPLLFQTAGEGNRNKIVSLLLTFSPIVAPQKMLDIDVYFVLRCR